ncbi:hypothetical protein AB5I41_23120 [Sphingomonas sp. MMS24-JH45]
MRRLLRLLAPFVAIALTPPPAAAQGQGNFDLTGPSLAISVERGAASLPIGQVPTLAAGDKLRIAARAAHRPGGALPADRRLPARRDQSAAEELVQRRRDLGEEEGGLVTWCPRARPRRSPSSRPTPAAGAGR